MTCTAKHHPSLVKKAVAAFETGETDGHIGTRGSNPASGLNLLHPTIGVEANLTTATDCSETRS